MHRKDKFTAILFSTKLLTKSKCQVSLVVKYKRMGKILVSNILDNTLKFTSPNCVSWDFTAKNAFEAWFASVFWAINQEFLDENSMPRYLL